MSQADNSADLTVTFLGTGGSTPSRSRSTASVLFSYQGEQLLIDCGEGTQRQMQQHKGLVQVDQLYLTHFHADHFLGLPGLLLSYQLNGRQQPLPIYGPVGLKKLFSTLRPLIGKTDYPIELVELSAYDEIAGKGYTVHPFAVDHGTKALGYSFLEDTRPGVFDPQAAKALGIAPGRDYSLLQQGQTVSGTKGSVSPEQVIGDARHGRKITITGDTAPARQVVEAAAEAQLLIHDASFDASDEGKARAALTRHSTITQAAMIAHQAQVEMLALVHISSRYHVGQLLSKAKRIHAQTIAPRDHQIISIPLPERGQPELLG